MARDIEVKKRGWVKNAAIAFLAFMLVLTFFSNTFMNRSLPEVAAMYTTSGTITTMIRGSGTIAAVESYEVKADRTIKVSEVLVKKDAMVAHGDVLLRSVLSDSDELENEKKTLEAAVKGLKADLEAANNALYLLDLGYERTLLDSPQSDYADHHRNIRNAENALSTAKQSLEENEKTRVTAESEYTKAEKALNDAKKKLSDLKSKLSELSANVAEYNRLHDEVVNAKIREQQRRVELEIAEKELANYNLSNPPAPTDPNNPNPPSSDSKRDKLEETVRKARERHFDMETDLKRLELEFETNPLVLILLLARENVEKAETALEEATVSFDTADSARSNAVAAVAEAKSNILASQDALDIANEALASAQREASKGASLFDIDLREKKKAISDKQAEIEKIQAEIDETLKELEELEKEDPITEITAPVAGIVKQINVSPGHDAAKDSLLMVIEVVDRGYTLSIPVTAEQSTRVSVGEPAEVDRGWWGWGEPISAVLSSIRPNPENPAAGRLLVFTIHGADIDSTTQLNITMAQRSENYPIIVPNSAIRSDANGDFILIVESRSSPLGNRFVAARVDVTILASDDTNTAISGGGLSGWDFVITTSTSPIEPGMMVRLADN